MRELMKKVEINDEIADELTEALTKQKIRMDVLTAVCVDHEKYKAVEKSLVEITQRIDSLKNEITTNFIPEEYRSESYQWEYNGVNIDGYFISIYRIA